MSNENELSFSDIRDITQNVITEVRKVVVGKGEVLQNIFIALLVNEHVLLEGVPGVAKTFMANAFAKVIGCTFKRIQFTPDLLPSDIVGTNILNAKTREFELRKGPIFANLVLADEINRAPPKTQSALLECMAERTVTIEGETHILEKPFMVLATQNPLEMEGTYPLPEAQTDRFLFKLIVDYPTEKEEVQIIERKHQAVQYELKVITSPEQLRAMQQTIKKVHIDADLMKFIKDIVFKTRNDPQILIGGGPRVSLALLNASKARAAILGRDFVTPDDIKHLARYTLFHRLILKPEAELGGTSVDKVISRIIDEVSVPI